MEQGGKNLRRKGRLPRDDKVYPENDTREDPPVHSLPGRLPEEPCFSKPPPPFYSAKKKLMELLTVAGAAFTALVGGGSSGISEVQIPRELAASTPYDSSQGPQGRHSAPFPPSPRKSPLSRKL